MSEEIKRSFNNFTEGLMGTTKISSKSKATLKQACHLCRSRDFSPTIHQTHALESVSHGEKSEHKLNFIWQEQEEFILFFLQILSTIIEGSTTITNCKFIKGNLLLYLPIF